MRYMIYEANHEKVPVKNEIEYIKNYIDLEKLRLEDEFPIEFKIEGAYEHLKISPLIFITFLENAFKHGMVEEPNKGWVKVCLKFDDNHCEYQVSNSRDMKAKSEGETGIGLQNTKRRLELSYFEAHSLEIIEKNNSWTTILHIDL